MSIMNTESITALSGTVTALEPAEDAEGNRKQTRDRREYSLVTVEYDDGSTETLPIWQAFEVAEHMVPVGTEVTLLIEEKVRTSRSLAGVKNA